MDYIKVLDSFGSKIEEELRRQFKHLKKEGREYHPFIADLYGEIEEFVLRGGRRLGSCSTLMVYKGYENKIDDSVIKACTGVELYRHSILVHDDIVDNEMMRRGGKTMHEILKERYDGHFGASSAIFIGNILYSLATRAVLESNFDAKKIANVITLFSSDFKDVNESQILDLLFEYGEPGVEEWGVMASKRAASLFRTCMLTGAVLGSAPKGDHELLDKAARHIGYAFDIQDDIIDTFASKEQYGREPCGDIKKKKKPLHLILALERDRRLASIMEKGYELNKDGIKHIQDLIRDCSALDDAKSKSREHAKEAQSLILLTEMSEEAKDFFYSFIKYIDESLDWYK